MTAIMYCTLNLTQLLVPVLLSLNLHFVQPRWHLDDMKISSTYTTEILLLCCMKKPKTPVFFIGGLKQQN